VLADVALALPSTAAAAAAGDSDAATAAVPRLWPLGLFAVPGSRLYMADVRLMLADDGDLQRALHFLQGLPSGTAHFYTVSAAAQ
jgi:hypothetical protein